MNSGNLWNNISMFLPTKHYSVEKDRWMKGHEPIIAHSRMCLQLACCCFSPSCSVSTLSFRTIRTAYTWLCRFCVQTTKLVLAENANNINNSGFPESDQFYFQ